MSIYKFKVYEEVKADDHITYSLMEQHVDAPTEITEKQLEEHREEIDFVITEKLLDKKRTGSATVVTEKNLDDAKDEFGMKHRNEKAYKGNINKLEEKRIAGDKNEDEKYEPSSQYSKKMRWWEESSPDKLKIATKATKCTSNCSIKHAQSKDLTMTTPAAPSNPKADENLYPYVRKVEEKEIVGKVPQLFIRFEFDPEKLGKNTDLAKKITYEKILDEKPYLLSLLTIEDLYDSGDNSIVLNAYGREYFPPDWIKNEEPKDLPEMNEEEYNELNVGGTPMALGKIVFKFTKTANIDDVKKRVISFINQKHPDLGVSEDSLDLSNINNGQVKYLITKDNKKNVKASKDITDFDIIIVSKKN